MSNVILRPYSPLAEGDPELITFNVVVEDADWVGRFDQVQIFRSVQGPEGPFDELTADTWTSPRLPATGGPIPGSPVTGASINIVGNSLVYDVNSQQITIALTGSDPLTYAQIASQIASKSMGRLYSYVDQYGVIVVEALYPGVRSRLTQLPSDGAVLLGMSTLEPDSVSQGHDPRPTLIPGQGVYTAEDGFGSRGYHYRTRFINSSTLETSDFSISFSGGSDIGVGFTNTIVGYALLADLDGTSMSNVDVHVHNDFDGTVVGGRVIAGGSQVKATDADGRVEFTLVRGQRLTVSVQGTGLVRTITVPTDAARSTFDLFDPTIGSVDVFRVAVPELITAERRTL